MTFAKRDIFETEIHRLSSALLKKYPDETLVVHLSDHCERLGTITEVCLETGFFRLCQNELTDIWVNPLQVSQFHVMGTQRGTRTPGQLRGY